jgi:hypothetical protein
MTPSTVALLAIMMPLAYLVAPGTIIWGWRRWVKRRPQQWAIAPTLSFVGFLFASLSGVFALFVIAYGLSGGFEHTAGLSYDSPNYGLLYRWIRVGALLSLAGLLFSIGGVWRNSSIRWHAPASAIGTLAFWLLATTWP